MRHQSAALDAAFRAPAKPCPTDVFAYLMDMGTGKSKVILDEWGEGAMSGGPQDLLVVAPAGSYKNWYEDKSELQRSELNVHLPPELRERMVVAGWTSGPNKSKKEALAHFLRMANKRPRALFVNVEALSSVDAARELVTEYLDQGHSYFAVDESTTIKNPRSIRTKWITQLGEAADVKRIATGLLTPNSPMDAFAQFNFLDWRILGFRSFYAFRARYAIVKKVDMGGARPVDVIVAFRNIEELQQKIKAYSYRVLKEDCLDLAPKTYLTRDVQHTKEQARVYRELRQNATSMLSSGKFVTVESILQQMIRLHQVNLGYVVDEDGNIHDIPEKRTDAELEVLEEHGGKAVIWTPFVHRINRLAERFRKEFGPKSVAMFYGGNRGTRGEDEKRFLGEKECRYMLSTQPAGMRGNTWTAATLNLYDSNTHDLEQRQQSEDRIHRKGQFLPVTNMDMMTEDTVDIKFVTSLRNKINMARAITGESWRAWI